MKEAVVKRGPWGGPYTSAKALYSIMGEIREYFEAPRGRSATGYGSKMPTNIMIFHDSRWKRVYACCFSNAATYFVMSGKEQLVVDFY